MPTILAHRGNRQGPSTTGENRVPLLRQALASGWGLEVDIRRAANGCFYLSHDPELPQDDSLAEAFCEELRRHPEATAAINIKERGYERVLVAFLAAQKVLDQVYLFDMELLEKTPGDSARLFHMLHPDVRIGARVSDRGESIDQALGINEASIVWLDEFDGPWATAADIERLKASGRLVHAVSPDLHQFSLDASRARWLDFASWGVDGICTDYPAELEKTLAARHKGAVA